MPVDPELLKALYFLEETVRVGFDALLAELKDQTKKLDQLVSREIKAAFAALEDARLTRSRTTRAKRLQFAEERLLLNTKLNPTLKTEALDNATLMALSHLGLAQIAAQRKDKPIAVRHLLQMFVVSPGDARTLAPAVFEQLFKQEAERVQVWFAGEEAKIKARRSPAVEAELNWRKLKNLGAGAAALGAGLFLRAAPKPVYDSLYSTTNLRDIRRQLLETLTRERDAKMNELCKASAEKKLASLSL